MRAWPDSDGSSSREQPKRDASSDDEERSRSSRSSSHCERKKAGVPAQSREAKAPSSTLKVENYKVSAKMPGWEDDGFRIFKSSGFVLVEDILNDSQCEEVLEVCDEVAKEMVDPERRGGNRGYGRYSFGTASSTGSILHLPAIANNLLGCGGMKLYPLLTKIFGSKGWTPAFTVYSGGGDFVLAGVEEDQTLHSDLQIKKHLDKKLPPPFLSVNFCVQALTSKNGPMRIVPGKTHRGWNGEEPPEWRNSKLFPVPAGAALVRDVRTLHGGTRNLSDKTRYLPSIEYVSAGFKASGHGHMFPPYRSIPQHIFDDLPQQVQILAQELVAEPFQPGKEDASLEAWQRRCWHGVTYKRR